MREEGKGLYGKYKVEKADGSPTDPEARYFVLRIDTDAAARSALRLYCKEIKESAPELARDLANDIIRCSRGPICSCRGGECPHWGLEEPANFALMRILGMM